VTSAINSRSQHATLPIDARVDNKKIVVLGEAMLVDQVAASFLPVTAHSVAAFDEANEGFLATVTLGSDDRIVILRNVQLQEVCCGKVCLAF
jgi:hypothetical protein